MKVKLMVSVLFLLATNFVIAQSNSINYKAIISDNGNVLVNTSVTLRFTILEGGSGFYAETHDVITDNNGIAIVNIGEGTPLMATYSNVPWGKRDLFLKTEVDTGSGFIDMGTTEFHAVPYAISGGSVRSIDDLDDAKADYSSLFIGSNTGSSDDLTGNYNTAIGINALRNNVNGFRNTATGHRALENNIGDANSAFGEASLSSIENASNNVAFGVYSSLYLETGSNNTAIGTQAGQNNISGSNNVFLGFHAGINEMGSNKLYIESSDTSSTPLIGGDFSTDEVVINGTLQVTGGTPGIGKVLTSDANGKASWETTTRTNEINDLSDAVYDGQSLYLGYNSGLQDDNSNYNTSVGRQSMRVNTSGRQNVSFGASALTYNETGSYNVALGEGALYNNIVGENNVSIGEKSGFKSLGNGNIFIGYQAGLNETGNDKLYIDNTGSDTPLIGGDFSTDEVTINGKLDITDETTVSDINITGKVKSIDSGDADLKAYIYGMAVADGTIVTASSSLGFTVTKIAAGNYKINFTGANMPTSSDFVVNATRMGPSFGFIWIEQFGDNFHIRTNDTFGVAEDAKFSFVVYKK